MKVSHQPLGRQCQLLLNVEKRKSIALSQIVRYIWINRTGCHLYWILYAQGISYPAWPEQRKRNSARSKEPSSWRKTGSRLGKSQQERPKSRRKKKREDERKAEKLRAELQNREDERKAREQKDAARDAKEQRKEENKRKANKKREDEERQEQERPTRQTMRKAREKLTELAAASSGKVLKLHIRSNLLNLLFKK